MTRENVPVLTSFFLDKRPKNMLLLLDGLDEQFSISIEKSEDEMRQLSGFSVLIFVFSLGCSTQHTTSQMQAQKSRSAPVFNAADIVVKAGESKTRASMFALEDYAQKLLKHYAPIDSKELQARGVAEKAPLTQYKITLDGFTEDGVFDFDLSWGQNIAGAAKQVDEAVMFLRDFHMDLFGSKYPPFYEIQIRPIPNVFTTQSILSLDGFVLKLNMYGGDHPNTSDELRKAWKNCVHLGVICKTSAAKKKWLFLNPVGPVITQFRQGMRRTSEAFHSAVHHFLKQSETSPLETSKKMALELVQSKINQAYATKTGQKLLQAAQTAIDAIEEPHALRELFASWLKVFSQATFEEEVLGYYSEAAFTRGSARARKTKDVWSLIYIDWTDDIYIGIGKSNDLIQTDPAALQEIDPKSEENQVDRIRALFTLTMQESETIDIGNLNLNLRGLLGAQSIALDRSLQTQK